MRASAAVALEDHLEPSARADFNRDQACVEAAAALAEEWNEAMARSITAGECPLWDEERVLGVAYDFDPGLGVGL